MINCWSRSHEIAKQGMPEHLAADDDDDVMSALIQAVAQCMVVPSLHLYQMLTKFCDIIGLTNVSYFYLNYMRQVTKLRLSCYLVLLSIDSKTR